MCIICVCNRELTEQEFKNCDMANYDGWGMAILRKEYASGYQPNEIGYPIAVHKGKVYKENDYKEYLEILKAYNHAPHVIHFRLASVGVAIPELTHPFSLSLDLLGDDFLDYYTGLPVLFHNGHFSGWDNVLVSMSAQFGLINGELSDTKVLAWAIANVLKRQTIKHVRTILSTLDDKFVLVNGDCSIDTFGHFFLSDDKGVQFSNMSFQRKHNHFVM